MERLDGGELCGELPGRNARGTPRLLMPRGGSVKAWPICRSLITSAPLLPSARRGTGAS